MNVLTHSTDNSFYEWENSKTKKDGNKVNWMDEFMNDILVFGTSNW